MRSKLFFIFISLALINIPANSSEDLPGYKRRDNIQSEPVFFYTGIH